MALAATTQAQAASCTPPPSGIVSWWPAEGNANDIVSGNNGTLQAGVAFASGLVGQALLLNNSTNAFVRVPASASLENIEVANGLTIEGWIDLSNVSGFHPIAEWNDGAGNVGAPSRN